MHSSFHLQCVVVLSRSTRLRKTVKGTPTYGRCQRSRASLSCFWAVLSQIRVPVAFRTKSDILVLLRNRLGIDDVTLPKPSFRMELRCLSVWSRFFDTAHLTELVSKTGCHTHKSLKMSSNFLIDIVLCRQLAFSSQYYADLPSSQGSVPLRKFSYFTLVYFFFLVHVRIKQCVFRWHELHVECLARDLHYFLNFTWQTVDVRKARKMVMESEIV